MSLKKLMKYSVFVGFFCFFAAIFGWLLIKHIMTYHASQKAQVFIEKAYQDRTIQTDDDKVMALASEAFEIFEHKDPAQVSLYKLRPYLTNRRLPEFLRLSDGVLETYAQKGLCDNAARFLAFALKQENIESKQWNMITKNAGHSGLLVTMPDNRQALFDPFYGYASVDRSGRFLHPDDIKKKAQSGDNVEYSMIQLGDQSQFNFYKSFATVDMAAQGDNLAIEASVPASADNKPLILGEVDNQFQDVKSAARNNNMKQYWYYMGHKYDRKWVRKLKTDRPVRIEMTLLQEPESGVITSDPKPVIDGKKLIWSLKSGDEIVFRDGLAQMSLKRRNSYIGVDQIVIYPVVM